MPKGGASFLNISLAFKMLPEQRNGYAKNLVCRNSTSQQFCCNPCCSIKYRLAIYENYTKPDAFI